MNSLPEQVRLNRRALGLSQAALATAAGVSLATVQNVEAGRANPALGTLKNLLAPLALDLAIVPAAADWDALVDHGLPLAARRRARVIPTEATLPGLLRRAAAEVSRTEAVDGDRRRDALMALLLALRIHYPRHYRKWFGRSVRLRALTPEEPSGRIIKLARIARAALAEYL
jgi:transcriptional regulator with XRE-family HTH domain